MEKRTGWLTQLYSGKLMLMIYGEGVVGILDADVTDDEVMAEFRIDEVVRVPPIRLLAQRRAPRRRAAQDRRR